MRREMKKRTTTKPRNRTPALRFTPTACAKLISLRDLGDTEVGGFGISSAKDLLLVEDVVLVRQTCTSVSVSFDDAAVADFFDQQIEAGRRPEQFGRIWIHTHPGDSAIPSSVDEETFERVFGRSDWSVMAILACGGQFYARLQFTAGPGGHQVLPFEIDYQTSFPAAEPAAWEQEYRGCVQQPAPRPILDGFRRFELGTEFDPDDFDVFGQGDPRLQ
jgi:hypothetical protein